MPETWPALGTPCPTLSPRASGGPDPTHRRDPHRQSPEPAALAGPLALPEAPGSGRHQGRGLPRSALPARLPSTAAARGQGRGRREASSLRHVLSAGALPCSAPRSEGPDGGAQPGGSDAWLTLGLLRAWPAVWGCGLRSPEHQESAEWKPPLLRPDGVWKA